MGGFRAQVQHALSEQLSGCTDVQLAAAGANADNGGNLCQAAASSGQYTGFRLTYNNGPLALAASSGQTKYPYNGTTPSNFQLNGSTTYTPVPVAGYQGDYKDVNFAGAYQLGATRLMAQMGTQTFAGTSATYAAGTAAQVIPQAPFPTFTNGVTAVTTTNGVGSTPAIAAGTLTTGDRTLKTTLLGVTHTMGALTLKGSYGTAKVTGGQVTATPTVARTQQRGVANFEDGAKQKQIAVGAVYDLSKRTAVYGTYSKLTTTGNNTVSSMGVASAAGVGSGGSTNATGVDLGVRHRF